MAKANKNLKVAIVHEFLMKMGGAERVVKSLLKAYPDADIFTIVYDNQIAQEEFPHSKIVGSFIQKWPKVLRKRYRLFFPLLRRAVEQWDLSGYDLVISSSSAFTHGVITNLGTKHICYYHSPTRYLWDWHYNYLNEIGWSGIRRLILSLLLSKQRIWDFMAAQRPEIIVANSQFIAERIRKFYRREAKVIYPPVNVERFNPSQSHDDYFLFVGALTPYKNVELAIRFFNKIGQKFKIVGSGKDQARLMGMANSNIEFLGPVDDAQVEKLMQNCKALIFPGEEDFGIVMVEAMAAGKPVFAFGKGGALEIVKHGETGWLFYDNNLASMEKAFTEFLINYANFSATKIRNWSEKFAEEVFVREIKELTKK